MKYNYKYRKVNNEKKLLKNYRRGLFGTIISKNSQEILNEISPLVTNKYIDQYVYAQVLYDNKNFDEAFQIAYKLSIKNYVPAKYILACMTMNGYFFNKDEKAAVKQCKEIIKLDPTFAPCLYTLGRLYLDGTEIKKAPVKGIELIQKAAKLNFAPAIRHLGVYYYYGQHGLFKDIDKARRYFKKLYKRNHSVATCDLAISYLHEKNYKKAYKYFIKSANRNNSKALYNCGLMHVEEKFNMIDYVKGIDFFKKAANQGNVDAMGYLGYVLYTTFGKYPNMKEEGKEWLLKACKYNNQAAIEFVKANNIEN